MSLANRREAIGSLASAALGLTSIPKALLFENRQAGEILIRGGRIVNADGSQEADVRIVGERIAEIGSGLAVKAGARVVDGAGKLVLPGGIDPHTHVQPPFADNLTTGSQAALAGGITSIGTFAFADDNETLVAAVERLSGIVRREAIADVFLHAGAWPPTPAVIGGVEALAAAGHPSIKLFMPFADFHTHLPAVVQLLETARAAGIVVMVHCEDNVLLSAAARRLAAAGRTSLASYGESRPVVVEAAATEQAMGLAESTGATIHVVHLSSARALAACRDAKARGLPVQVETRPLYLHLTEERMSGPTGPLFIGQPPLRTAADSAALWAGLKDGTIDVLATDHAPWTRAQKLAPDLTITNLRPGVSDLQFMLPIYFSEGVGKKGLSLERFVATTSTNAARIFGLYPDRGVIRVGAIADLAIWDPRRSGTVRAEVDYSASDYSPYEGWPVTGWPTLTIRRGEVVAQDGRVSASAGTGRVITRGRR
jgi:dihydropyrimidinase